MSVCDTIAGLLRTTFAYDVNTPEKKILTSIKCIGFIVCIVYWECMCYGWFTREYIVYILRIVF